MMPSQRRISIFEYLQKEKFSSISELSNLFKVSPITIHRDLIELEKEGSVSKVHGGAMLVGNNKVEPRINVRLKRNREEKREIAKKAVRLVHDETSIFLDHSSTCIYLSREITSINFRQLGLVTNSVNILFELEGNSNINLISTGGTLQRKWSALSGPYVLDFLSKLNFDQIFISCGAISIERGLMTSFPFISEILRKVSEVTREINLLVDSSKFSKVGTFSIMPVAAVTRIITDKKLQPKMAERLKNLGIDLIM